MNSPDAWMLERTQRVAIAGVTTCLLLTLAGSCWASIILDDQFDDLSLWDDLSTVVAWDGSGVPGASIFDTSSGGVTLDWSSQSRIGFGVDQTRMFQAIDHRFAQPIQRSDGVSIQIDFSAKWDSRPLHNEGSRFVLSLNHGYPPAGLDLTPEGQPGARVGDFSFNNGAAWARPAYSLRLRTLDKESLLAFGGGPDVDGNYEATAGTWLPGFIQSPGGPNNPAGGSPEVGVPGVVGAGLERYSQSDFLDYRYVVAPLEQQLWIDLDGNGEFEAANGAGISELVGSQPIATPTIELGGIEYTRAFNTMEGVRLFWRGRTGSAQAIIDSLRITVDGLEEELAGDYNHDHVVNAADYTVWRDSLGSTADLAADGDGSGTVDLGDYGIWQQNFGAVSAAKRSGAIASVPEPPSIAAPTIAAILLAAIRNRRSWRRYSRPPSKPDVKSYSGRATTFKSPRLALAAAGPPDRRLAIGHSAETSFEIFHRCAWASLPFGFDPVLTQELLRQLLDLSITVIVEHVDTPVVIH